MSDKPPAPKEPAKADSAPEAEATVPLDEFCAELSLTERSVEAIAAWRSRELAQGKHHDTRTAYAARFRANAARPTL